MPHAGRHRSPTLTSVAGYAFRPPRTGIQFVCYSHRSAALAPRANNAANQGGTNQ